MEIDGKIYHDNLPEGKSSIDIELIMISKTISTQLSEEVLEDSIKF